ncbi:protein kcnl f; protein kcnl d; protein kcnl b; p rotein kcnl a [Trichuris trichiura]|uniref:Protein kcnl f protein kcnl d protein kcnl b p rotein kcnl a n=1 Tax=Trichuris trichiura TaxID=36087 RepID=A0A077ZH34_TRITR|nr:protein kcnl f; protein kcnl d; protein kcnl b; p rotein kcnl a [Trichuris trichiura]
MLTREPVFQPINPLYGIIGVVGNGIQKKRFSVIPEELPESNTRNIRYFSLALDPHEGLLPASMEKSPVSTNTSQEWKLSDKDGKVSSSPTVFPVHQHSEERNPLYEVSNEYMKIIGGQQVFKSLLKRHGEQRPSLTKASSSPQKATVQSTRERKQIRRKHSGLAKISLENDWSMRLRRRKILFYRRIKINDYCFLMALAGIAIVVLENEFAYGAQISLNRTGADDWRVAMTATQLIQLCFEIVVLNFMVTWTVIKEDRLTVQSVSAPLNAILSILMLCRLYLLGRFMALRSKQFQDAATRSIAALNRITVDFAFILKSLMYEHPIKVLLLFTAVLWLVMAWMFRQCERFNGSQEDYLFSNAIWFVIITFLSIGYGDVTPTTYCGRGVSITTGIIGAGVSSAVIAVISRQMELTRAEKQVNNFMSETKLSRQCQHVAAKVLQNRWFIHKYSSGKSSHELAKLRSYQKKFLAAINEFKHVKWEQRKTNEEGNALVDVAKMQKTMHEALFDMKKTQEAILNRVDALCHAMQMLNAAGQCIMEPVKVAQQ